MNVREKRAMLALGRTLRMWSLIRMLPIPSLLPLQAPLLQLFAAHPDLSEDELVKLGLKHLHKERRTNRVKDDPKDHPTLSTSSIAALLRQSQR